MKNSTLFLFTGFQLIFSSALIAGTVYDRIDECESRGGGACLYSLLRELAGSQSNHGSDQSFCECRTSRIDHSYGVPSFESYYYDVFKIKIIAGVERPQQITTRAWYGGTNHSNGPFRHTPQECTEAVVTLPACR
ncbi:MAG: hypothetical protein HYZ71_08675 [Deltaproteobacteria bacterium]|nr:hypothetical protein [Deltaproteobacteria bacterium]